MSDEGPVKHFRLDEGASLVDIVGEIGTASGLMDVSIKEPTIEESIRTFYQRRAVPAA
ncbi:hypothetical protein D3C83_245420 [compost metagenome]